MTDLGQLLRKARMERNISLDELQETTKIRKRYLEAIEEGKYNVLPGTFYVRAFIKQYSEAVGLDADEVFRLYAHEIPSVETETSAEPIRLRRRRPSKSPERIGKWATVLLLIAFPIVIVCAFYYYFYHHWEPRGSVLPNEPITNSRSTGDGDSPAPVTVSPSPTPTPTPEPTPEPEPDVEFVERFTYENRPVERYVVKNADKIRIELKITGVEAWVGISPADAKDKTFLYQRGMVQGDEYSGEFDENIYVNIGRANAVNLVVNGVEMTMASGPNPQRFQFELEQSKTPSQEE